MNVLQNTVINVQISEKNPVDRALLINDYKFMIPVVSFRASSDSVWVYVSVWIYNCFVSCTANAAAGYQFVHTYIFPIAFH